VLLDDARPRAIAAVCYCFVIISHDAAFLEIIPAPLD